MRYLAAILALCLLAAGMYFILTDKREPASSLDGPVIVFGDSLARGIGASEGGALSDRLSVMLGTQVINAGRGGETTASARSRLDDVVAAEPSLVIVILGGNDALQGVPKEQVRQNMAFIIEQIAGSGSRVLLLGVPGGPFTHAHHKELESLADEKGIRFAGDAFDGIHGRREYMADTLHLNDAGYAELAKAIESDVRELLNL